MPKKDSKPALPPSLLWWVLGIAFLAGLEIKAVWPERMGGSLIAGLAVLIGLTQFKPWWNNHAPAKAPAKPGAAGSAKPGSAKAALKPQANLLTWLRSRGPLPWGKLLVAAAIGISLLALKIVASQTPMALFLFVVAGFALAFAPLGASLEPLGEISLARKPYQKWEPYFVAALLILGIATRVIGLNELPAGAINYEGELTTQAVKLSPWAYTPHSDDLMNTWPTMYHYQGLFFARLFGNSAGSFRLVSAFWGVMSLLVFYFLARQLSSPGSAAIGSLFFAASLPHLIFSRRYHLTIQLVLPPMVALGLLLQAFRSRDKRYVYAAGAAAGFSLHGFFPGRGIAPLFMTWFGCLYLIDRLRQLGLFKLVKRPRLIGPDEFKAFWYAFLATGGVVALWAIRHSGQYWGWVHSMDPNKGQGLSAYFHTMMIQASIYAQMFHIMPDPNWRDDLTFHPMLSDATAWLFPLGLFAAIAMFWRSVNLYLIGLFILGMLPAMMSNGFPMPHPTVRRAMMAFPAIYLFSTLAIERIRLAYFNQGRRWLNATALLAALGVALLSVQKTQNEYIEGNKDFAVLTNLDHVVWFGAKLMQQHPDAALNMSEDLVTHTGGDLLLVGKKELPVRQIPDQIQTVDDLLVLDGSRDHVLILSPYLENAKDLLSEAYPGATIEDHSTGISHFASSPWEQPYMEPFNLKSYGLTAYIPAASAASLHGLLDPAGNRVAVFSPAFGPKAAGTTQRLSGIFMAPYLGASLKFELGWPGWTLRIDGQPVAWSALKKLKGGANQIELQGRVPLGAEALPLKIMDGTKDLMKEQRVLALKYGRGFSAEYVSGADHWGQKPQVSRTEIWPVLHFSQDYLMALPISLRLKATLRVPRTGEWKLLSNAPAGARIKVNGQLVYDNIKIRDVPTVDKAILLNAGQAYALEIDHQVDPTLNRYKSFLPEIQGPGDTEPQWLPGSWLSLKP